MPSVNLIPPEMLHKRRRRKGAVRWACGVGLAYLLALVPWVREQRAAFHLADAYEVMDALDHSLVEMRESASDSKERLTLLAGEWERAQKLRAKRAWSGLMQVLSMALPPDVWLEAVSTNPSSPTPSPPDRSGVLIGRDGPRRIILTGFATQIEALFSFERQLRSIEEFKEIQLKSVQEASFNDVQVTRFSAECAW